DCGGLRGLEAGHSRGSTVGKEIHTQAMLEASSLESALHSSAEQMERLNEE
ncbi:unnamed protein product, partial [Effrenium voratum]